MIFDLHNSTFSIYFLTQNSSYSLDIKNDSKEAFEFFMEIVSIFCDIKENQISLEPILEMDKDIKKKCIDFCSKYIEKNPQLHKFKKNISEINIGEYIFFNIMKTEYNTEEILFFSNLLKVHNIEKDDNKRAELFQNMINMDNEIFGDILKEYDIKVFDTSIKRNIGKSKKEDRVCRFCKNSSNTTKKATFKLKAHAISEALGNKQLVLNEECDECNARFGSSIEKDFIQYLDIFRVFYGVKGKNGIPTIKFKDDSILKNVEEKDIPKNDFITTKNLPVIITRNMNVDKENGNFNLTLKSNHKIKTVNIYKTLCKYILSLIADKELKNLEDTIKWIDDENSKKIELPKVAFLINNSHYVDTPFISIYIRKNNDNIEVPHIVGEFKFKSLIYVFILPFSKKDKKDFSKVENYNYFFKFFKHYSQHKDWISNNFSCIDSKEFQFNINFENINNQELNK